jgi:prophage DNA circulation protein
MGVPFHVKQDHESVGRRLVKHEYPNSEDWFVEDLGVKTPTISVTGYISTDCEPEIAYLAAEALVEACGQMGPNPLILPPSDFFLVHCDSCKRSFDKDIQGYMAFDMEFIEEGDSAGEAPFQIGLAIRLVSAAFDGAAGAIIDIAASTIEAIGVLPEALLMAGDVVRTGLAVIDDAAQLAVVQPDYAATLSTSLATVVSCVTNFENSGSATFYSPPNKTLVQPIVMAAPGAPPSFGKPALTFTYLVTAMANYMKLVTDTTTQPMALAANLQSVVMQIGQDPTPNYGKSVSPGRIVDTDFSTVRQRTIDVIGCAQRILAAIAMCQAYADTTYETRQQAQQARGLMVATVDQVVYDMEPHWPGEHPGMTNLIDARDQASAAMLQMIADLQPTVQMELTESMPALYLAYRIYQDANRAQELADRNDAPHPMWMPANFEAKAS